MGCDRTASPASAGTSFAPYLSTPSPTGVPLMIRSLLVPLDGSSFGEQALPPALALARKTRVTIHLVQVLLPVGSLAPEMPLFADEPLVRRLLEQQRAAQQAYLNDVARRLSEAGAPRVQTWLVEGDVVESVRQQVEAV